MNRDRTHRLSLTVSPSLIFQHVTVNVGDKGVRVPNNGMCIRDITTNIRNVRVCVNRKFGLELNSWRWSHRNNKTHVEDMEDPIEVQPPGDNRIFVVLCVDKSGE